MNHNKQSRCLKISLCWVVMVIGVAWVNAETVPLQKNTPPLSAPSPTRYSLEKIMSHTDWMGNAPEQSYFSLDGRSIYYTQKAQGSEWRETYKIATQGGKAQKLTPGQAALIENSQTITSPNQQTHAWVNRGNIFVSHSGKVKQLTKTGDFRQLMGFVGEHQIAIRQSNRILSLDTQNGVLATLLDVRLEDNPDTAKTSDYLSAAESRLFDIIKLREKHKKEVEYRRKELDKEDSSTPSPLYLGKGRDIQTMSLSPNGQYLVIGLADHKTRGRNEKMPHYISEDAYVKIEEVRSKVGTSAPTHEWLYLVDIANKKWVKLNFEKLEGINEDPLLPIKKETAKKLGKPEPKADVPRAIYVSSPGVRWSANGQQVAVLLRSYDNKDRWIISLNVNEALANSSAWQLVDRETNAAWINTYAFAEMDFTPDGKGIWFLSEKSGYSHLYLYDNQTLKAITPPQQKFEVSDVSMTRDGQKFYYRANKKHAGIYEAYRSSRDGKHHEALTDMGGMVMSAHLSPNEDKLLITHSRILSQPDLYVLDIKHFNQGDNPVRLTHTNSAEFDAMNWMTPEIIPIPSKHGAAAIYSRVYRNTATQSGEKKPAVMFVHGAGYLQANHYGWSNYFREMMFHNLLVQNGYVVIDMDYRASQGYGAAWRTAIYRQMGTPELEDYLDGIDWLVENANVDRNRVGIYGGSYGGFMTFMALFKSDAFAAGAALRPVADWAHYNHGYTASILNTPDIDPDAYARSSPIEFASGLKRPLLICSGMIDDNVFFQDSVRMVQRLIELKNPNFEMAIYPIESHGFKEPESWLDEYRRIFKLMERDVKHRQ